MEWAWLTAVRPSPSLHIPDDCRSLKTHKTMGCLLPGSLTVLKEQDSPCTGGWICKRWTGWSLCTLDLLGFAWHILVYLCISLYLWCETKFLTVPHSVSLVSGSFSLCQGWHPSTSALPRLCGQILLHPGTWTHSDWQVYGWRVW